MFKNIMTEFAKANRQKLLQLLCLRFREYLNKLNNKIKIQAIKYHVLTMDLAIPLF